MRGREQRQLVRGIVHGRQPPSYSAWARSTPASVSAVRLRLRRRGRLMTGSPFRPAAAVWTSPSVIPARTRKPEPPKPAPLGVPD